LVMHRMELVLFLRVITTAANLWTANRQVRDRQTG
jgi:hypothetical protein